MPDPTADPVAAALEQIRADHEAANYFGALADDPVPSLLAAVSKVLALHARQDKPVITRTLCGNHAGAYALRGLRDADKRAAIDACPDCVKTKRYVCEHCRHECPDNDGWPCPTYQAVAAGLLGPDQQRGEEPS